MSLIASFLVSNGKIIIMSYIEDFLNWLTSQDWLGFISLFALILIGAGVIVLVVTFIVLNHNDQKFAKNVQYDASGARVYRLDMVQNEVVFFDLSNIQNKKTVDLDGFYSTFPKEEQQKIVDWIDNIFSGKQTTDFLQTDVYLKNHKKIASSFLRLTKSSPSKGVLHLESYLLKDTVKKRGMGPANQFVTETQFANSVKQNGVSRGTTFCFSLKHKKLGGFDNNVPRNVCSKFRAALDRYLPNNTKLMKLSETQLLACNFDINDREEAVAFALRTINGVNNILSSKAKGNEGTYVLKAGIVSNKDVFGDVDSLIDCSQRTALNAYETSSSLVYYRKGYDDYVNLDVSKYRSEVERIIFDKRINNLFKPVYGVSRHTILGYVSKPVPDAEKTSFATIEELKNYAIKAKDQNNLFGYLAKTIVSRFISERPLRSQRLFYPIMVRELQTVPAIFSNLRGAKEANIVFLLRENEIFTNLKQIGLENIMNLIKDIHEAGFSVGLIVQGKSISAEDSLLKMMDIFFVDFTNDGTDSKHMDMVIRSQLHALVEKLLKYHKIIVGANLSDWNAIELVIGSGIDYVSSDQFGPYQNGFVPLKEKDELRLKEMKGNK